MGIASVGRAVLKWLHGFPGLGGRIIRYGYLSAGEEGLALFPMKGEPADKADILGRTDTEYRFTLIYRVRPGCSDDERLKADEFLESFAAWCIDACGTGGVSQGVPGDICETGALDSAFIEDGIHLSDVNVVSRAAAGAAGAASRAVSTAESLGGGEDREMALAFVLEGPHAARNF